jgi:hypothetical protein
MFAESAIGRGLSDRQAQATASIDALLLPEKPGDQEEVRDLYTHSIPGAGEDEGRPRPKISRDEKPAHPRTLPHSPPAVPVARSSAEKTAERDRTPPQATLRKQAVSDILAGGL